MVGADNVIIPSVTHFTSHKPPFTWLQKVHLGFKMSVLPHSNPSFSYKSLYEQLRKQEKIKSGTLKHSSKQRKDVFGIVAWCLSSKLGSANMQSDKIHFNLCNDWQLLWFYSIHFCGILALFTPCTLQSTGEICRGLQTGATSVSHDDVTYQWGTSH